MSDLTFDASGNIILDTDSGNLFFKDNTSQFFKLTYSEQRKINKKN